MARVVDERCRKHNHAAVVAAPPRAPASPTPARVTAAPLAATTVVAHDQETDPFVERVQNRDDPRTG